MEAPRTAAPDAIEDLAAEVAREHDFAGLPVCPVAIARHQGIAIQTSDNIEPGITGLLMRVGERFAIYYSSQIRNEGRIRFTISHELGHYFLPGHAEGLFVHGDGVHRSRSGFDVRDQFEREADLFASCLLMPRGWFLAAAAPLAPGFGAIEALKTVCGTSITATAIRYARLCSAPVAVVISRGADVEFCFMSQQFRSLRRQGWIRKGSPLPARCQTRHFNAARQNVSHASKSAGWGSLDDWIPGAPQIELKEDVVGLGGYGRTLTVLFIDSPVSC